jgi:hypothetical protein
MFSSNLSIFDLFWISLVVHFAAYQPLVLIALIPLLVISSVMKTVVDKQEEEMKK